MWTLKIKVMLESACLKTPNLFFTVPKKCIPEGRFLVDGQIGFEAQSDFSPKWPMTVKPILLGHFNRSNAFCIVDFPKECDGILKMWWQFRVLKLTEKWPAKLPVILQSFSNCHFAQNQFDLKTNLTSDYETSLRWLSSEYADSLWDCAFPSSPGHYQQFCLFRIFYFPRFAQFI